MCISAYEALQTCQKRCGSHELNTGSRRSMPNPSLPSPVESRGLPGNKAGAAALLQDSVNTALTTQD